VNVDVVMLTWNDGDALTAAIESVLASSGVSVKLIVVDNASEPPAVVPDDPRVSLVRNEENRGVRARNQGAALADSEWLAIVDSDVRLEATTLHGLVNELERDGDVALAAPVFTDQPATASAGRAPTLARKLARGIGLTSTYGDTRPAGEPRVWDVDFSITACVVLRRSAFDAVGGLDERYFYGPEDVDLCLRLRSAGWRIVQVADANCVPPAGRRNRRLLTRRGLQHGMAIARHLWRHRHYQSVAS